MIDAIEADSPGVKDGKVVLHFLGEDKKRHDFTLGPRALKEALVGLMRSAGSLPQSDQVEIKGTIVPGGVALGIGPGMQPVLVIVIGGVEIPMAVSENELALLYEDIAKVLSGSLDGTDDCTPHAQPRSSAQ